jgi:hypothetical protein
VCWFSVKWRTGIPRWRVYSHFRQPKPQLVSKKEIRLASDFPPFHKGRGAKQNWLGKGIDHGPNAQTLPTVILKRLWAQLQEDRRDGYGSRLRRRLVYRTHRVFPSGQVPPGNFLLGVPFYVNGGFSGPDSAGWPVFGDKAGSIAEE